MLDKDDINKAIDKKYTEFSDRVKTTLRQKMSSHEIAQNYSREFDRLGDLRQKFAAINSPDEE